jgi:hypothetical protein
MAETRVDVFDAMPPREMPLTCEAAGARRGANTRSPITKRYNFYPSSTESVNGCDGRVVDCA